VAADQQAVAAVQARHPDLLVAETGDASITRAIDNSLDFRQAEATSVPITLILLLVVFGALVAAGIPLLLALAAPALGMRLGEPAVDVPPGQAVVATSNAIQRAFPQAPSPAEVVVTGPDATGPRVLAAVAALQGRAATAPGAARAPSASLRRPARRQRGCGGTEPNGRTGRG
jgi:uncharacterized membrane protein YdfJ with MMPL/SSD domain